MVSPPAIRPAGIFSNLVQWDARHAFLLFVLPGRESGEDFESELVLLFGIFAAFCFGKRKKPRIFVSKRRLCELYHIVH